MKTVVYEGEPRNVHKDPKTGREFIKYRKSTVYLDTIKGKYKVKQPQTPPSNCVEFILFYMPWCPFCKMVYEGRDSEWSKFEKLAKRANVLPRKINCETSDPYITKFKDHIAGYPTFVIVAKDCQPQKYEGNRTAADFVAATTQYRHTVGGHLTSH